MSYLMYIIESQKTGRWYVGSTGDIERRLGEHNAGKTKSTRPHRPYKVIYIEEYRTEIEAREREKMVKRSGRIRKELKTKLTAPSRPEGLVNV